MIWLREVLQYNNLTEQITMMQGDVKGLRTELGIGKI